MDELEIKAIKLKNLLQGFETQMFLGALSQLITMIDKDGMAQSELGNLSSPLRQLYYLGGLLLSSTPVENPKFKYTNEEWNEIVCCLNEIESEYLKLFIPTKE